VLAYRALKGLSYVFFSKTVSSAYYVYIPECKAKL